MPKATRRLTELSLSRIDLVDDGDNPRAKVLLYKSRPAAQTVLKYDGEGMVLPKTTDEIIAERQTWELWRTAKYAFTDSLGSILAGAPSEERLALLQKSVKEFVARVKQILPEAVAKALDGLVEAIPTVENMGEFAKRARVFTDEADRLAGEVLAHTEDEMPVTKDNPAGPAVIDVAKLPAEFRPAVEAIIKRANDAETAAADAKATADASAAALVGAEKVRADKAEAEVARLRKLIPGEEEDPLANLDEVTRKRIETSEERIAKMEAKEEVADLQKRAAALNLVGTTAEKIAPLLHRIQKGKTTEDDMKELFRLLKASSELARKGGLTEKGFGNAPPITSGDGTAYERAAEMAQGLVKNGEVKSFSKALGLVFDRNPELYKEHVAEKRSAVR